LVHVVVLVTRSVVVALSECTTLRYMRIAAIIRPNPTSVEYTHYAHSYTLLNIHTRTHTAEGVLEKVEIGEVLGDDYQFVYQPGEEEKSWPGEEATALL